MERKVPECSGNKNRVEVKSREFEKKLVDYVTTKKQLLIIFGKSRYGTAQSYPTTSFLGPHPVQLGP